MLELILPEFESWDEVDSKFVTTEAVTLELEHSLVALSKWESKWEIPFLGEGDKTNDQTMDYIRCMTLTPDVDPEVYHRITNDHIRQVSAYIEAKMTATWVSERNKQGAGRKAPEIITSELIYYWMISMTIPFETQHWHLNRLLMLIKVCGNKNSAPEKLSKSEIAARNKALNEERKAKMKTRG